MSLEISDAEGAAAVSPPLNPTPITTTTLDNNSEPSIIPPPTGSSDDHLSSSSTCTVQKPTWRSQEEEGIIEIEEEEEELPSPSNSNHAPPFGSQAKKAWIKNPRPPRLGPSTKNSNTTTTTTIMNTDDSMESFNTAAEARRKNPQQQQQQLGSKPKMSSMSLLSSAVAHATMERCLLGVTGGETIPERKKEEEDTSTSSINFSRQCKPGHVIDILELRRLSSRGVPDEPPEVVQRSRAASAPVGPTTPGMDHELSSNNNNTSSTNTSGYNPHRSYRPLVWRVLLGYLPPQTDLWNEVLGRDRALYNTLVNELFSNTCPHPHDVFTEAELKQRRDRQQHWDGNGNEVYSSRTEDAKREGRSSASFVIDDEDAADEAAPGTPPTEEAAPPPATTPMTPGLLSARMRQEWVRGEGGADTIFDGQNNGTPGSPGSNLSRLSPMCAMNTPRTRIRKEAFLRKEDGAALAAEEDGGAENDDNASDELTKEDALLLGKNDMQKLSSGLKEALLLPNEDDDGEDDDGEGGMETITTFSISIDEEEGNNAVEKKAEEDDNKPTTATTLSTTTPHESSPSGATLARSISITRTSSEDDYHSEGVELGFRQSGQDGIGSPAPIPPAPPSMDTTDEEENLLLLDEIRKDVIRTHPDLRFFLEPKEDLGQKRYAALERILFVWAKLNKGVRYVQGMNEIVGTLYFVLAHDSNSDWANESEADTYFLFNSLMVEMRDVFVPDLDEADTGIHGRISNMITLLSLHDPETRCHLDSVGIDPSFYSVRWLTTLLSREFLLPDTIRLWDSMFASTHKDNFLRYVSVTMVMVIREQLLTGDFSACLRLLQAYPPTNLDRLLESSRALWIYESQITLACHKGGISLGHALRSINPPPAIVMAYGLPGGVAPPIREQVRQVGERGLAVARGAANGASTTVASAGRSFIGNAINFWRAGSGADGQSRKQEVRRSKSTM